MANYVGASRNWDVIIDDLLQAGIPSSDGAALIFLEALEGVRHRVREESRTAIGSPAHGQMISAFMGDIEQVAFAQLEDSTSASASASIGEFARGRVKVASRRLDKLLILASDGRPAALHRARIQIKKLRYLLEYFSPVLKKADRKRIVSLAQLQGALGGLNDIVVASRYISELVARAEYAPAHELFMQWLQKEKKVRRREAVRTLRELSRKR